ncbi:MAG: hypothetical protein QOE72_2025 [Chloroflexota bacterium]|jgi:hypothetical protein|nr:hypothetical protein [Chloroflexota bacterium]
MADRITHTAGTAVAWMVMFGVVAHLVPEAARDAKEYASELAGSLRRRFHRPSTSPDDLARQVRELAPISKTW